MRNLLLLTVHDRGVKPTFRDITVILCSALGIVGVSLCRRHLLRSCWCCCCWTVQLLFLGSYPRRVRYAAASTKQQSSCCVTSSSCSARPPGHPPSPAYLPRRWEY